MQNKDWMRSAVKEKGFASILGPLEAKTMQVLWKTGGASTGQVYEELRKDRGLALTTVSGTLNRLYEKGLLDRQVGKGKRGLSYFYTPKMSDKKFKEFIAKRVTRQLLKEYEEPTVSTLISSLAENPEKLEELRRRIESILKK